MAMKLDADQKIQEKQKNKNLKHEYKMNFNVLLGLIAKYNWETIFFN